MIKGSRNLVVEYASLLFLGASFIYFSHNVYYRLFSNFSVEKSQEFQNFDIYVDILQKYGAKNANCKIVQGYVEAFITKDHFDPVAFEENENFLLEEFSEGFLVTFKPVKKVEKKKRETTKCFSQESNTVQSAFFLDKDNWFVIIDGQTYTPKNRKIADNVKIVDITYCNVHIAFDGLTKTFFF